MKYILSRSISNASGHLPHLNEYFHNNFLNTIKKNPRYHGKLRVRFQQVFYHECLVFGSDMFIAVKFLIFASISLL